MNITDYALEQLKARVSKSEYLKGNTYPKQFTNNINTDGYGTIITVICETINPENKSSIIYTRVQRFSEEGTFLFDANLISDLLGKKEIYIKPILIDEDGLKRAIQLNFKGMRSTENSAELIAPRCNFSAKLSYETIEEIEKIMIKLCDPTFDFNDANHFTEFDEIINLLRRYKSEGPVNYNELFLQHWDKVVKPPHEKIKILKEEEDRRKARKVKSKNKWHPYKKANTKR